MAAKFDIYRLIVALLKFLKESIKHPVTGVSMGKDAYVVQDLMGLLYFMGDVGANEQLQIPLGLASGYGGPFVEGFDELNLLSGEIGACGGVGNKALYVDSSYADVCAVFEMLTEKAVKSNPSKFTLLSLMILIKAVSGCFRDSSGKPSVYMDLRMVFNCISAAMNKPLTTDTGVLVKARSNSWLLSCQPSRFDHKVDVYAVKILPQPQALYFDKSTYADPYEAALAMLIQQVLKFRLAAVRFKTKPEYFQFTEAKYVVGEDWQQAIAAFEQTTSSSPRVEAATEKELDALFPGSTIITL